MKTKSLIACAVLSVLFGAAGCDTPAKFSDVSADLHYAPYVGASYIVEAPMYISGVNAPPGYEKTVDYYVIGPVSPSWSGPELITRERLPPETLIIVESVHRCTNCIFEPENNRLEATIRLVNYSTPLRRPTKIRLKHLAPEFARIINSSPNPAR